MPLPAEFIAPQHGAQKQDCERDAAKRWLAKHGSTLVGLRPVYLGDDLFACQPIAEAINAVGGNFILTCKPSSHQTIAEYLEGADLSEHRETVSKRGKRITTIYRWLSGDTAARHRRCPSGKLVLHRDPQPHRKAHLLQQLHHRPSGDCR